MRLPHFAAKDGRTLCGRKLRRPSGFNIGGERFCRICDRKAMRMEPRELNRLFVLRDDAPFGLT